MCLESSAPRACESELQDSDKAAHTNTYFPVFLPCAEYWGSFSRPGICERLDFWSHGQFSWQAELATSVTQGAVMLVASNVAKDA